MRLKILAIAGALLMLPLEALAVRLGNCDDKPHRVEVTDAGTRYSVTLEAGEWREFNGIPLIFQMEGQEERRAPQFSELCIWDGVLSIQRRSGIKRSVSRH